MQSTLPREVYAYAKSMGIDLKDLEPEAQDIWKMLTEMQQRNPAEYEQFIQNTIAENKDAIQTSSIDRNHHVDDDGRKMIRPTAGFSIHCYTKGGDGLKVREISSHGKHLYINLCSHIAIQKPKYASGINVEDEIFSQTDGMEIPMIVGSKRDDKIGLDEGVLVVDVLVHPFVIYNAKILNKFQGELIDLVMTSVESETKVLIDHSHPWSISNKSYECGRGEDRSIPALFPVDKDDDPQRKSETSKESLLSSTSSLIESVIRDRNEDASLDMIARATTKGTISQTNHSKVPASIEASAAESKERKTTFKKGFLSNASIIESKSVVDKKKLPSAKDNHDMDRIFGNIDSEWNQEVRVTNDSDAMEDILTVRLSFTSILIVV